MSQSFKDEDALGELFEDVEGFKPEHLGDKVKIKFRRSNGKVSVMSDATNAKGEPMLEFDLTVGKDGTGEVMEVARDLDGKKKHQVHLSLDEVELSPFIEEVFEEVTEPTWWEIAGIIPADPAEPEEEEVTSETINVLELLTQLNDEGV